MTRQSLPIDEHLEILTGLIRQHAVLLLAASPGSGKTTRLPPALLRSFSGKTLVLEPRRIAAVTAAHRICDEESITLGTEVGYQIRFEDRSSKSTRLLFLTEALLQKKLLDDPTLEGVEVVILDEFHERSVHTETALALLLELQESFRPDLHLVIMSATLQIESLRSALPQAEIYQVKAPPYPLEVRKDLRAMLLRPSVDWYERMGEKVREALRDSPGQKDVLVFLPGVREINELAERLRGRLTTAAVLPLHAQLPVPEQLKALQPIQGQRRIILATNVAESALTLQGVDSVVDSGLERIQQVHHRTGFPSLDLVRISKASAIQRAGRAARQGPGLCLEVWSTHDEVTMAAERPPEIHRIDLSELRMTLSGLGILRPETLKWIDPPPPERWKKAQTLLQELELIDDSGRMTTLGERVIKYPLHPRWGKLLSVAADRGVWELGCQVAALLQSWGQEGRGFVDLEAGLHNYQSTREGRQFSWTRKTEDQLRRLHKPASRPTLKAVGKTASGSFSESAAESTAESLQHILFASFPDRLCRKREGQDKSAVMVGARGLRLPEGPWKDLHSFLALEVIEGLKDNETQCSLLLRLSENFVAQEILPLAEKVRRVEWNDKEERFSTLAGHQYRGLWLDEPHREPARPEDVEEALIDVAFEKWTEIESRNARLHDWLLRYRYFQQRLAGSAHALSESQIRQVLAWACQGERALAPLYEKDFATVMSAIVLGNQAQIFETKCPEFLATPRGKQAKVHYPEPGGAQAPRVEVRIQDAFGWPESPRICGEALVIDLLAPNGRAAQRTQDLKGFWSSSYLDVRKDLRARYPKHAWPENPMAPNEETSEKSTERADVKKKR